MNALLLETWTGTFEVCWGSLVAYEGKDGESFSFWWRDLWPESMETIRNCPVWNEDDTMLTFDQLKDMIEDYDERIVPHSRATDLDGEEVPDYALGELHTKPHHYLNH